MLDKSVLLSIKTNHLTGIDRNANHRGAKPCRADTSIRPQALDKADLRSAGFTAPRIQECWQRTYHAQWWHGSFPARTRAGWSRCGNQAGSVEVVAKKRRSARFFLANLLPLLPTKNASLSEQGKRKRQEGVVIEMLIFWAHFSCFLPPPRSADLSAPLSCQLAFHEDHKRLMAGFSPDFHLSQYQKVINYAVTNRFHQLKLNSGKMRAFVK